MSFILSVKVIPKSAVNQIVGWEAGELKIRLRAVPEKGKANEELIQFLAKKLDIAKSRIEIISGSTGRHKRLAIQGLTEAEFLELVR